MAEARTDRGIALTLYLSQKTVEAHVSRILRKLDLPTDATENRRVHACPPSSPPPTHSARTASR
jgi:DNA-binding NarL/FixJ family response regulator